jgi:hypothetical protein
VAERISQFILTSGVIGWVVVGQAILLSLAVFVTGLFLYTRSLWLKHKTRKQEQYERILIELLFESEPGQTVSQDRLPNVWFWQEAIYRDVILHQIGILSGNERLTLTKLYVRTGFLEEDKRLLKSRHWWIRLRALIRIDLLSLNECRDIFYQMMDDPSLLVAMCATRALSRLTVEIDCDLVFTTLERVGRRRNEAAIEVLSNLVITSGPQRLISYLEHKPDSPIAVSCIRVLGEARVVESVAIFLQIMNTPTLFANEMIIEVLEALRKIADPAGLDLAKVTLHHPSPMVRAKSVLFLQELGEPFSPEDLLSLQRDSSVEVQRVLQKNYDQGQAA